MLITERLVADRREMLESLARRNRVVRSQRLSRHRALLRLLGRRHPLTMLRRGVHRTHQPHPAT